MKNELELEELISAFVDGELTSDEQLVVERALNQSPRYRQIHDEFVAMRASLQALPREQLEPDFTRRVLERINRVKPIAGNGQSGNGQLTGSLPAALATRTTVENDSLRRLNGRRGPSWARHPATWVLGVAATILLAVVLAPNQFGLPFGDDSGLGTIGAGENPGNRQNPESTGNDVSPIGPESAIAEEQVKPENQVPVPEAVVEGSNDPSPSELNPSPRLVNTPSESPKPKNPSSLSSDPAPENDPSPQIARATPEENTRPSAIPAVESPLANFVVNYTTRDLHVVRLNVSPQAMRARALDEILETEGISFRAAGGNPEFSEQDLIPEIDVLLVHAVPAQLDGVFGALKKKPDDFRPMSIYTAPQDRFFDLADAIVDYFLKSTLDPGAAPKVLVGSGGPLGNPGSLPEVGGEKVFAWRAPPLGLEVFDKLFPVPGEKPTVDGDESRKAEAGQKVQMVFILFRGK
jgi:negative regulator of sigma E activity